MEIEGSLPHSQALPTCPYSEPDQSSPCHPSVHPVYPQVEEAGLNEVKKFNILKLFSGPRIY